uniref:Uncharacterized protein n=1 Tax=Myoviridae sp. ctNQV2 TaxID=2827683 RepID=A0A8S5RZE8_9CAUD|nr:MAG TPA: hypothetical protein [Myoviridae sp. ctNQV2]
MIVRACESLNYFFNFLTKKVNICWRLYSILLHIPFYFFFIQM